MPLLPRRFERLKAVLDRRMGDLTVVLEHVDKPHNLSAILRSCDAVGVLEAIEEVLDEYKDGELTLKEAMEEIQGLVEEFQAVRALSEMAPEELMALAEEEEEDEGGLRS